jgi:hypothetical protein
VTALAGRDIKRQLALGDDAKRILTAQTKTRLTKLFDE